MQAILRKIDSSDTNSFVARVDESARFYNKWHFHPELELTYIIRGTGTRFVGDHIEYFEDGDLVLVGSNLPHVWKSDQLGGDDSESKPVSARVIQFLPGFLGETFLSLKELDAVNSLLDKASSGLKVDGETKNKVADSLARLFEEKKPFKRLCIFLDILGDLAVSGDTKTLSSRIFVEAYQKNDRKKINDVFEFTFNQFHRKIMIQEAAGIIHMSVPNFCKYFKSRTQKTYLRFLTEVRIGIACKMLIEDKKSIQQIAFDCGFINLSNFNRTFKLLKKQTPIEYRKAFVRM